MIALDVAQVLGPLDDSEVSISFLGAFLSRRMSSGSIRSCNKFAIQHTVRPGEWNLLRIAIPANVHRPKHHYIFDK